MTIKANMGDFQDAEAGLKRAATGRSARIKEKRKKKKKKKKRQK